MSNFVAILILMLIFDAGFVAGAVWNQWRHDRADHQS